MCIRIQIHCKRFYVQKSLINLFDSFHHVETHLFHSLLYVLMALGKHKCDSFPVGDFSRKSIRPGFLISIPSCHLWFSVFSLILPWIMDNIWNSWHVLVRKLCSKFFWTSKLWKTAATSEYICIHSHSCIHRELFLSCIERAANAALVSQMVVCFLTLSNRKSSKLSRNMCTLRNTNLLRTVFARHLA